MTKVNIATHLNQVFTRAMTARLEASPTVDTRKYLGPLVTPSPTRPPA